MKDRAPEMYRELKAGDQLATVLKDRATLATEIFEQAMSETTSEALKASRNLSHQETVQELTAGQSEFLC